MKVWWRFCEDFCRPAFCEEVWRRSGGGEVEVWKRCGGAVKELWNRSGGGLEKVWWRSGEGPEETSTHSEGDQTRPEPKALSLLAPPCRWCTSETA